MEPERVPRHPGRVLAHARTVRRVDRPGRRVACAPPARRRHRRTSTTSSASPRRGASGWSSTPAWSRAAGSCSSTRARGEYAGALELKFLDLVDQGDRAAVHEATGRQRRLVAAAVRVRPVQRPHRVRDLLDRRRRDDRPPPPLRRRRPVGAGCAPARSTTCCSRRTRSPTRHGSSTATARCSRSPTATC